MHKMKTKKALVKRFKKTARGKVKRPCAGKRHLASSKTRKRKRNLRGGALVSDTMSQKVALLMP